MKGPRFARYGRTRHLRIADASDLRQILALTRTRWIATAAPISAFDLAPAFLAELDTDRDGRILPHELRAAIDWTLSVLDRYTGLDASKEEVDPANINGGHPDGERVLRAVEITRARAAVGRTELHAALNEVMSRSAEEARAADPPQALSAVREKIEEFFFLSRVSAAAGDDGAPGPYDERLASALGTYDVRSIREALTGLPIARPNPDGRLPLTRSLNPAFEPLLSRFRAAIVEPTLGPLDEIDEASWRELLSRHEPPSIQAGFADDTLCLRLAIRLSLFQENLLSLANSFVSCPDLYHPERRALFEAGTLYLGGFAFTFSVKVPDRRFHAEIARSSNIFVMYAAVYADGPPLYEIAVPVTSGTGRNLFRGKSGVFLDVHGREWNAEVVEIAPNPVSLMEAVVRPFRRLGELLGGRMETLTHEAETGLERTAAAIGAGAPPGQTSAPVSAQPPRAGFLGNAGAIAGAGLAVAAITSALAFITSALSGVPWWHIAVGVVGAAAAVVFPAFIAALIKLSRRDLSVILEGTRWAMNSPLRLTRRQGRSFTRKAPRKRRARRLASRHPGRP